MHVFPSPLLQSCRAMPQTENSPEDPTWGAVQEDPFKDCFRMPLWVCPSQPTRIKPATDTSMAFSHLRPRPPFPSWTSMWIWTTMTLAPRPRTHTTQWRCHLLTKMLSTTLYVSTQFLLRVTTLRHNTQPGAARRQVEGSGSDPAAGQRGWDRARSAAAALCKHARTSVSAW